MSGGVGVSCLAFFSIIVFDSRLELDPFRRCSFCPGCAQPLPQEKCALVDVALIPPPVVNVRVGPGKSAAESPIPSFYVSSGLVFGYSVPHSGEDLDLSSPVKCRGGFRLF